MAFDMGLPGISNSILSNPIYSAAQSIVNSWYSGGGMGLQDLFSGGAGDSFSPSWDLGGGGAGEGSGGGPDLMNGIPIAGDAAHYGMMYDLGGGVFAVKPGRSVPYGTRAENQPPGTENNVGVYSAEYASTHMNSKGQIVDTASNANAPLIEKNVTGDWAGVKSSYWTDRLVNYTLVHPETKDFIKDFIYSNNKGDNFAPGILPIEDEEFNKLLNDYAKKKGISQEAIDAFNKSFSKFEPDGAVNDTIEGINEDGEVSNIREFESETRNTAVSGSEGKSTGNTDSSASSKKTTSTSGKSETKTKTESKPKTESKKK
jgi:hypothetical protein